ncbi:hypothetical protein ASF49_14960 [Methylobacterium sp. Leaf104]|uniref:GGDEF domain-containing protein n=1 Tax=Methylobacterium TaxID=407 RepID=UPI0006F206A7|nr:MULTISPECIES: GGDEF domain-containing protein [Methylobacterium]KQP29969.1 hypothetical protein ASF49_14960 [Methylobacterium sp. Leaf104]MCI9882330.1 diguanylate cyclase [Methylobacterium goesingense]
MPRSLFRFRTPGSAGPGRGTEMPIPTRALATRLMRVIFGCYIMVAIALTGVQMAIEYRRASDRLRDDLSAMERTFSPGLEDALWRFNAAVLTGILTGMTELPAVLGVEVRDENGRRVQALGTITGPDGRTVQVARDGAETAATPAFGRAISRTFALVHTERNGQRYPTGSWTLHSNDAIAIDQVKNTLIVILINSALKSLVLGLIFFVVIRHMVGRPLAQISRFLAQLDADTLGAGPLTLAAEGRHELHALTNALNTMIRRLRRAFEENARLMQDLREMNASLQARVAERTQDLERLANTDLLTGLDNRRRLDAALEAAIAAAEADGTEVCVILADVDHFKAINDRHGHKIGDRVLVALAAVLAEGARPADTIGRWGGEEFMIVCPRTGVDAAATLAEHLRRQIATTALPVVGTRTCSFGVAALRPGETSDGLVTRADAALYRSKHNGRNQVTVQAAQGRPIGEAWARGAA